MHSFQPCIKNDTLKKSNSLYFSPRLRLMVNKPVTLFQFAEKGSTHSETIASCAVDSRSYSARGRQRSQTSDQTATESIRPTHRKIEI